LKSSAVQLMLLLIAVSCSAAASDPRELVRVSLQRFEASAYKYADYAYLRYYERKQFESDNRVKRITSVLVRREPMEQFLFDRVLERDGKPVSKLERLHNETEIRRRLARLKALATSAQQEAREADVRREIGQFAWIKELVEAFDYELSPREEARDGRPTLMLSFTPRRGYRAKDIRARAFEKATGQLWIDKADTELARAEARVFDRVTIGWWGVLGQIERGTTFHLNRRKIDEQAWLIDYQSFRLVGKAALMKSLNREDTTRYSEYKHRLERQ
jgi:hypothetical protein